MATDNNIKNYTAIDIEKYHKSLLSPKEMHDLEKAALDDPFLADAMEGYAVAGVNVSTDINDLKKRLAEKVETGKVIAMKSAGKTSFPWLRVAALVIVLAGAGLLAKQFIFTDKTKDIAQAEPKKIQGTKTTDTANSGTITSGLDTKQTNPGTLVVPSTKDETNDGIINKDRASNDDITKNGGEQGFLKTEKLTVKNNVNQPVASLPTQIEEERKNRFKVPAGIADKKEIAKADTKYKNDSVSGRYYDKEEVKDQVSQTGGITPNPRKVAAEQRVTDEKNYRNQVNTFRGRVTDESNVGVPFANVTNAQDNNAGTYTDAKGYFNLTYPDSVLTVQVRSIGFENNNVQLRNNVPNNQVIMQDDRRSLSEVVVNNQKTNAVVRRDNNNVKLEEPEPADGWDNYDTYVANNLNVPEEIKTKQSASREVQVSFEVDKNGEPINIKVEKTLCSSCDQEAVRLIKEGPKWKRHAKKGRTTVTISFDHSF